jgi:hypothetical protein
VGVADVDPVAGVVAVDAVVLSDGLGGVVADVVAGPAEAAGSAEQPARATTTTAARTAPAVAATIRGRLAIRCATMAVIITNHRHPRAV